MYLDQVEMLWSKPAEIYAVSFANNDPSVVLADYNADHRRHLRFGPVKFADHSSFEHGPFTNVGAIAKVTKYPQERGKCVFQIKWNANRLRKLVCDIL